MSEMEPREAGIDTLLRRHMAEPAPSLPPDFDRRVMRGLVRSSQTLDPYRRILLTGYALTSVVVSTVVMRSHGLAWPPIAIMIIGPPALVVATSRFSMGRHLQRT